MQLDYKEKNVYLFNLLSKTSTIRLLKHLLDLDQTYFSEIKTSYQ